MAIQSLTCGEYDVYVAQKGGETLTCRLYGTTDIRFRRVLNDFSDANISVAMDSKCVNCLASINPWQHELLIFRNTEMVWCGPIMSIKYLPSDSKVEIYARDLLAWTEKRVVELVGEDYDVEEVDIREVFEWLLNHSYAKDPWNMSWDLKDTGIPVTRFYPGYYPPGDRWGGTYPVVADEMRSLSQAGIDYTVVNRQMYAGDLEVQPPNDSNIITMDHNWVKLPEILVSGTNMSTRTIVAGGQGGYYGWYDDQIWITESDEDWGLLETFTVRSDIDDAYTTEHPNPITQEAYARHALLSTPLVYVTGGQLAGDSPFAFNDLIPGVRTTVGLVEVLREIETDYRIYNVEVSVNKESEEISLSLSLPGVEGVVEP